MIRVTKLRKHFGATQVLRGINFEVAPKTVLGIIGGSGCGKTTLLRCLNGLERVTDGAIECGDVKLDASLSQSEYRRRVKELRRRVGTVFQHFYLFPHLSVLGNITEAPVHVLRRAKKTVEAEAHELLDSVGLSYAAGRYPESLSGGEQQRVAIARALAMRPELLLFDEPTSALDPKRTSELRTMLREFVGHGHTMVIVSHSLNFLAGAADYMLYLESGEIVEQGPTKELLEAPKDPRTKEFIRHAG